MKKLGIVGGRDFDVKNPEYRKLFLSVVHKEYDWLNDYCEIVSGGARGADSMGRDYATTNGAILYKEFPAEWNKYGRSAGYKRNRLIVEYADEVIAFWDGKSRGTKHTIDLCEELGVPCRIINY